MKNVLLVIMAALFITCMGGVFVGIAAAMVGTMGILMPIVHVFDDL